MDIQALLQAVSSVGFPIVCCGAMMYYVKYSTDRNREDMLRMSEQHKTEIMQITEAINNNTLALQKLSDNLETQKGIK